MKSEDGADTVTQKLQSELGPQALPDSLAKDIGKSARQDTRQKPAPTAPAGRKTRASHAAASRPSRTGAKARPASEPPVAPKGAKATPAADKGDKTIALPKKIAGTGSDTPKFDPKAPDEILKDPALYLNRELTWISFNRRVLNEAQDARNPLLERVKFLAIASSNLDEFFMKRIGGLKQLVATGVHQLTVDGRTPQEQIVECGQAVRDLQLEMRQVFVQLLDSLKKVKIRICGYDQLSEQQRTQVRETYLKEILPLVTPLAMDPAHPFPFISNLSLSLLVTLRYRDDEEPMMNRIKVPMGPRIPRFLRIDDSNDFVPLEAVMAHNLDLLFPDMSIESCEVFRVTRNANTEIDEEQAEDLLSMIETELRYRKFAPIVRLEIEGHMAPVHRGMLAAELGLNEQEDVFESDVLIGMRDLMELAFLDMPELHDPDHRPVTNAKLQDQRSIFHAIRDAGSILLQFPYESFASSVERFVREASRDPKVRAIKMTLYRTSADTEILEYLIEASRNGKQVAVAVELKARFDEAANIRWASRLENAGIHVTYGVVGLKTHAKAILVVRQDYSGLRRYAHIGTGNYHAGTSRIYSDLGLLTCDDDIGHDLTELFNYLTSGCKPSRRYKKLLTAPKFLKRGLLEKIEREIELQASGTPGLIRFKTNALEDVDVTQALYRASEAGVKVDLIVRDTCRLRPGLPGFSENITVISVLGRFLEHCRIYYFKNGGAEEYFIGSADLMRRNLERRVELVAPIEAPALREELNYFFESQLGDQRNVWDMKPDGSYIRRTPAGADGETKGCQAQMIEMAEKRLTKATRLRRLKPRAIARRSVR